MCGIYGIVSPASDIERRRALLERMGRRLRHRGPDGRGTRLDCHAALGCERLRIVDRVPRADQPLRDPLDRIWLVCNGEIYNANALRRRFADYRFRSRVDVEVIIPLYLARGPEGLAELEGMFAFALWDRDRRRLVLARDRAGEKPLFWTRQDGEIVFASEIQALLEHPGVTRELDAAGLRQYAALGYILEPRSPFAALHRLEAGTVRVFDDGCERILGFWHPEGIDALPRAPGVAATELDRALRHAVRGQLTADVPVGVFSSGGLDSGMLTALACRARRPEDLITLSVGFAERSYDETGWAAAVARHFGLRHVHVRADEAALAEAFNAVVDGCAEPLADPAALPTWLLARAAKQHVGAVLSGEGADELFGGYPTYLGHAAAPVFAALPRALRRLIRAVASRLPASYGKVPFSFLMRRFVEEAEHDWRTRHLRWFGTGMLSPDAPDVTAYLPRGNRGTDPLRAAMLLDYRTYLRDNLLVKVDRTSMLHGLEVRSPFLDSAVTALAFSLPTALRVRGFTTKWLLKQVAARYLPQRFVRRRKRGLSVPVAGWINGGLRREVDRVLDRDRLCSGLYDPNHLHQLLREHRAGTANHARALWPAIIFEKWRERWVGE